MASITCLLVVLNLFSLVAAAPSIYFPFNSQLPPVARISEVFSYTLSPQTFSSPSTIKYSLNGAPEWLSIDENTGRLAGRPEDDDVSPGDVVGIPVDIVADDGSGSTAMTATLVVSRNPSPKVSIPLNEQIGDFGDQSAPGAIVSYPASPFTFSFDRDTFSADSPLNYYATSADSSPLPSWMAFDAQNLTFSGQTPPFENLIQPPQKFDFRLVASDVEGFSASSIPFSVVVGSRKLTIANPVIALNSSRNSTISYSRLADDVKLDGKRVQPSELQITADGLPSWLTVDEDSLDIQGTVPADAQSSNATLVFRTALSDSLSVQLQLIIATTLFRKTLGDVDVTVDEEFELDLESYFWQPEDVRVEVKTDPEQDWLSIDGLVLSGTPPESASEDEQILLSIKATIEDSGESETETVDMRMLSAMAATSATRTPTPLPTTATNSGEEPSETSQESSDDKLRSEFGEGLNGGQIALAVILPILIIATLVAIFILLRRRREKKFKKIETKDISGPLPGTFVQNASLDSQDPSIAEAVKTFNAMPPPAPTYRPGQKGYLRAALQRMRSTRTTSSFDSDSQHSFTLAPPRLPRLRSASDNAVSESRNSWLTDEGHLGFSSRGGASHRNSRNSILSIYDSIRDFPSRRRYMRAQTESSWRSTLDVTIPSMEDDRNSLQPTPDAVYLFDKAKNDRGTSEQQGAKRDDSLFLVQSQADVETKAPAPQQRTPLGSHPTHGKRFTPEAGAFMIYNDNPEARDSQLTVATASVFGTMGLSRQESRGSELSHIRPVSRRSDASPWFSSRPVMPARSPFARKYQFDPSSDIEPPMPTLPSAALSPSTTSGGGSSSIDQEPNWRTISRDSGINSTSDWQTIPRARSSLDMAYEDLIRQSPFHPSPAAVAPPRPVKSAKRSLGDSQENLSGIVIKQDIKRDKSWMGKGVSLRPRPLQQSDSNASLMSPTKWPKPGAKTGERPVSSIRHVRSSARSGRELGATTDRASMRNSRGMYMDSDESGGWVTDGGSIERNEDGDVQRVRESTFGLVRDESRKDVGAKAGHGKAGSEEFAVFI